MKGGRDDCCVVQVGALSIGCARARAGLVDRLGDWWVGGAGGWRAGAAHAVPPPSPRPQVFLSAVSSVTVSLAFIADLLGPRNRAACFGLIMASFRCAGGRRGGRCAAVRCAVVSCAAPRCAAARSWRCAGRANDQEAARRSAPLTSPPHATLAHLHQHMPPHHPHLRSVAIFIGPTAGSFLPPLSAAVGALATVGACAAYTLLLLPESLSPEKAAVGGVCWGRVGWRVRV